MSKNSKLKSKLEPKVDDWKLDSARTPSEKELKMGQKEWALKLIDDVLTSSIESWDTNYLADLKQQKDRIIGEILEEELLDDNS